MYRGDGAWIGILSDGRFGVGVEPQARASLAGSGFVPLWPYLERDLSVVLAEFSGCWAELGQGGISTPVRLVELTVESAWKSRRTYWMELAAEWAVAMSHRENFDQGMVRRLLVELRQEVRDQAAGRARTQNS